MVPAVEIGFEELSYRVSEGAGSVTLVAVLSGAISLSENVTCSCDDYGRNCGCH